MLYEYNTHHKILGNELNQLPVASVKMCSCIYICVLYLWIL